MGSAGALDGSICSRASIHLHPRKLRNQCVAVWVCPATPLIELHAALPMQPTPVVLMMSWLVSIRAEDLRKRAT